MENEFVKRLLKYVDDTTKELMDDPDRYKAFLDYLSRMDSRIGISNKIIIYAMKKELEKFIDTDTTSEEEYEFYEYFTSKY
ncbi:hypothetical protein SAMN04487934_11462 [Eubacterium ruminantium]|nr:hypothetical protein SAMN04487934_11462 [Eubacterium ruminantium]